MGAGAWAWHCSSLQCKAAQAGRRFWWGPAPAEGWGWEASARCCQLSRVRSLASPARLKAPDAILTSRQSRAKYLTLLFWNSRCQLIIHMTTYNFVLYHFITSFTVFWIANTPFHDKESNFKRKLYIRYSPSVPEHKAFLAISDKPQNQRLTCLPLRKHRSIYKHEMKTWKLMYAFSISVLTHIAGPPTPHHANHPYLHQSGVLHRCFLCINAQKLIECHT
jgi:hypothetical protein